MSGAEAPGLPIEGLVSCAMPGHESAPTARNRQGCIRVERDTRAGAARTEDKLCLR